MITFANFNKHVVQLNIHKCDNLLWFCLFLFLIVLNRWNKYFYYEKLYFRWKSRHRICCLQKAEQWRLYSFYHGKTPLSPPWGKRSARVCENGGSRSTCVPREIQPELKMELTTIWASLKTLDTFFLDQQRIMVQVFPAWHLAVFVEKLDTSQWKRWKTALHPNQTEQLLRGANPPSKKKPRLEDGSSDLFHCMEQSPLFTRNNTVCVSE